MASGGYRPPANPASVSGPGALSQRTDSPPPIPGDGSYGDTKNMTAIQSGAPMSPSPSPGIPMPGFGDPSMNPDEPVTAGSPLGDGAGPEALGSDPRPEEVQRMKRWLPQLQLMAKDPATPQSVKALFEYIRGA